MATVNKFTMNDLVSELESRYDAIITYTSKCDKVCIGYEPTTDDGFCLSSMEECLYHLFPITEEARQGMIYELKEYEK